MAAVRVTDLHLWPRGRPTGSSPTLGSIHITGIDGPWAGDGGLRVGLEYRPPKDDSEHRRLVNLEPRITSSWPTRQTYGRAHQLPDPPGRPGLLGTQITTHWWVWSLTLREIELIEAERAPNAGAAAVPFYLVVTGAAVIDSETFGFHGETQFTIATAEWLDLLRSLGYGTSPSLQGLVGDSMTLAPSWAGAEEKLREARRHLALGDDREALRTAYVLFDQISANPFRATWEQVLGDPECPAEKAAAIQRLLQAEGEVLNKLGRHPSWDHTNGGDRPMLPLDHWEAELAIALAQLLLAAAERWRSIKEAHERERPTAQASDSA